MELPWGRPRFRHGDDHHEHGDHSDGGESQEGRVVAKCRDDGALPRPSLSNRPFPLPSTGNCLSLKFEKVDEFWLGTRLLSR